MDSVFVVLRRFESKSLPENPVSTVFRYPFWGGRFAVAGQSRDIFGRVGAFFSGFAFAEQGGGETAGLVAFCRNKELATILPMGNHIVAGGNVLGKCLRPV